MSDGPWSDETQTWFVLLYQRREGGPAHQLLISVTHLAGWVRLFGFLTRMYLTRSFGCALHLLLVFVPLDESASSTGRASKHSYARQACAQLLAVSPSYPKGVDNMRPRHDLVGRFCLLTLPESILRVLPLHVIASLQACWFTSAHTATTSQRCSPVESPWGTPGIELLGQSGIICPL